MQRHDAAFVAVLVAPPAQAPFSQLIKPAQDAGTPLLPYNSSARIISEMPFPPGTIG
jgi:hypothetical protein